MKSRGIVAIGVFEIDKVVVMYPRALGHGRASGTDDFQHLPFGVLVLERVMVDLMVIARNCHVGRAARDPECENVSRNAAVVSAIRQFDRSRVVREFEARQDHIGGRTFNRETGPSLDLDTTYGLRDDLDGFVLSANRRYFERGGVNVRAIPNNNSVARSGVCNCIVKTLDGIDANFATI